MRGGTHAIAGITIALMISAPAPPVALIGVAIAGGIGALLPDLDHPQSAISRRAWLASASLRLVVSHRGALHSLLAMAAVMILASFSTADWSGITLATAVGYCSHVALDALTVSGVPLLWPWRRRFSVLPLRTGGTGEKLLMLCFVAALIFMFREPIGLWFDQVYFPYVQQLFDHGDCRGCL